MSGDFDFIEELPSAKTRKPRTGDPLLDRFAAALKKRPGVWAKYPKKLSRSGSHSIASSIRRRRVPGCPYSMRDGGFDATSRDGVLYVRYVGDER